MSTVDTTDQVAAHVTEQLGDRPGPAAATNASQALKWWDIVEVEEVGFRAFVRLPNDWQHKDIREKAQAAKARRRREMKNPNSDAYEILEAEIDMIAENPEAESILVNELLDLDVVKDRHEAMLDVRERDEFEHIRQDQERFAEMHGGDPALAETDEFKTLVIHIESYAKAVDERLREIQQPKREALEGLGLDGLLNKVREIRIDGESSRAFMDSYGFWQTFAGTLKVPEGFDPANPPKHAHEWPRDLYFKDPDALRRVEPNVGAALSLAFDDLEDRINTLTSGNS